jgi:hypothetical protein
MPFRQQNAQFVALSAVFTDVKFFAPLKALATICVRTHINLKKRDDPRLITRLRVISPPVISSRVISSRVISSWVISSRGYFVAGYIVAGHFVAYRKNFVNPIVEFLR